ncbi:hypothetical protein H5410_046752 [Solanum commersonii]|uniref:Uncharacterized protein n=1 Tax=Solanum commersonii TaxID=4109 RepID=A0A9J5XGM0_SOLCO|nr:hypothetical protein H5410_046752 [Solanum commersonii]
MDDTPVSIGTTQLALPNVDRVYDSDDDDLTENISKRLHDPLSMTNQSMEKEKEKKDVPSSSKVTIKKILKKKVRKVGFIISRPTLTKV